MTSFSRAALAALLVAGSFHGAAVAQEEKEPRRIRVGLGAQLAPSYPGSDKLKPSPLFDLARTRGDKPFAFEAPDESFDLSLIKGGGIEIGPVANLQGSRTQKEVGAPLARVDTTIEAGAFVQARVSPGLRLRAEGRKGIGGHEGVVGMVGADFITRDKDRYLFSIGPRVTLSDTRYHRAYFGVTPAEAAAAGVGAYSPEGGVHALGATASFLTQLGKQWGLYSYAKYDRLVGDAGRSPVVRQFGSRDQFSGGLALTYTFVRRR